MTSTSRDRASVEVELEEVAEPGTDPGGVRAARGGGGAWRRRDPVPGPGRRPSRRSLVAGAAVVAGVLVALAAWAVPDRAAPVTLAGAAPALTSPLGELWRLEVRSGWSAAQGLLLVPGRSSGAPEVVAHDLRSGAVAWRLPADDGVTALTCPVAVTATTGPALVCQAFGLLGPADPPGTGVERHPGALLVVSARDGAVVERLPLQPDHLAVGEVDGDLVVARRTEGGVEVVRRTPGGPVVWRATLALGGDVPGPAARVEIGERAVLVTGTATVLLDGADGERIGTWGAVPQATVAMPRLASRGSSTGVRVDRADGARGSVTSWFDADGALRGRAPGLSAEPAVTDGVPTGLALADDSGALRGVGLDTGDVLWSLPDDGARALVRAGGAVVVVRSTALVSVDLGTGAERWSVPLTGADVVHPVSDGDVVLATGLPPGRGPSLSALSLEDGSLRWRSALPPGTSRVEVADGHVLAVGGGTVVGLG